MADKKQTLYEVLEVSPNASLQDIKAAHRRLTESLVSGKSLLNPQEIELRRQVLNLALDTLSTEVNRNAYDAKLAAYPPAAAASKANTGLVPQGLDARAIMTLASMESARGGTDFKGAMLPVKVVASAVDKSTSALWKMLKLVGGVVAVIILLTFLAGVVSGVLKDRRAKPPKGGALSEAEEKVMLQEYYQQHGVRPGSKAELDLLEKERQRKVSEQYAAEAEKRRQDEAYRRFIEDSRQTANQVSRDLQRDEDNARRQEMQRQQQEKQQQEYQRLREEQEERHRINETRRQLGLPPN